MNAFNRKPLFTRWSTAQASKNCVLLCALVIGVAPTTMAQERSKPKNAAEIKAQCNQSFSVKLTCKFATSVLWSSAISGNPSSQFSLGNLYRRGYYKGAKQHINAEKWFLRAASQNHCAAQYWLASLYKYGSKGVSKNEQKSNDWIEKGALSGCKRLKDLYDDDKYAYSNTKKWAVHGNKQAQFNLALLYNKPNRARKNNNHSFYWMFKAAEQNFAQAQLNLGLQYFNGLGVEKNNQQALYWIKKSADQNLAAGKYFLGLWYANGDGGKRNIPKALELFTEASNDGYYEANFRLATLYADGDGVEKDLAKADALKQSGMSKKRKDKSISQLIYPEQ